MRSNLGKHECTETKAGYVCSTCGQTFKHWRETTQYCTGKGLYSTWDKVPEHLKTTGQWAKEDQRPAKGKQAKAWVFMYIYGRGHFWADLWTADQVVSIKRRKAVLSEANAGIERQRTEE